MKRRPNIKIQFVFISLYGDEKLLNAFKSELIALNEDFDWLGHELVSHLEDLLRKSCGDDYALQTRR